MKTFEEATKETFDKVEACVTGEEIKCLFDSFGFRHEVVANERAQYHLFGDAYTLLTERIPQSLINEGMGETTKCIGEALGRWFYMGIMIGILMEKGEWNKD